jgi:hypothetical protein
MLQQACPLQLSRRYPDDFAGDVARSSPFIGGNDESRFPARKEHIADTLVTLYKKHSLKHTVFLMLKGVDIFYSSFANHLEKFRFFFNYALCNMHLELILHYAS